MRLILDKSDIFGALASTLCVIHCLATPFIFIAHTNSVTDSESSLIWWRNLDYIFLIISFFAVARSAKNTSKIFMKPLLWISWITLFLLVINEKVKWVSLPETIIYITAITLAVLHIYNLKFCQCKTYKCCTYNE
ncbi:MerC domain-containing protein [Ascidiimonas sp. W6]|uniref:MerC domain-containing protein n=1 Tax=Ascidiimonas meishanensis TaxID=3128903 RepID=UPI0030EDEF75